MSTTRVAEALSAPFKIEESEVFVSTGVAIARAAEARLER